MIVRLAEWLVKQDEPISEQLWAELVKVAMQNQDLRAKVRGIGMLVDRFDPVPKAEDLDAARPVTVNVLVVRPESAGSLGEAGPQAQANGVAISVIGRNGEGR